VVGLMVRVDAVPLGEVPQDVRDMMRPSITLPGPRSSGIVAASTSEVGNAVRIVSTDPNGAGPLRVHGGISSNSARQSCSTRGSGTSEGVQPDVNTSRRLSGKPILNLPALWAVCAFNRSSNEV